MVNECKNHVNIKFLYKTPVSNAYLDAEIRVKSCNSYFAIAQVGANSEKAGFGLALWIFFADLLVHGYLEGNPILSKPVIFIGCFLGLVLVNVFIN